MIERGNTQRGRTPTRTIIAAIAMLVGVGLMGFGSSRNEQGMLYAGVAVTLCGIMVEAVFGILGVTKVRHRKRRARA